ncbi:hypothetical protein RHOSPDRAFT_27759 [Rhodotorula sp. JG-1b]|nr:hypothetical protein RHOSPDRAFT_27759 [Rhodotorula sp. JG-1b]
MSYHPYTGEVPFDIDPVILDPVRNPDLYKLVLEEVEKYRSRPPLAEFPAVAQIIHYTELKNQVQLCKSSTASILGLAPARFSEAEGHAILAQACQYKSVTDKVAFDDAVEEWLQVGNETAVALWLSAMHEFAAELMQRSDAVKSIPHEQLEAPCQSCTAFVLAMSPIAMLERMASPYSGAPLTIVNILDSIRDNVLQHQKYIEEWQQKLQITLNVRQHLAWLSSIEVRNWYASLHDSHKRAFAAVLRHLARDTAQIGARDGCYIALTYIKHFSFVNHKSRVNPHYIEGFMMHMQSDHLRLPFPGSPHDENSHKLPDHLFGRFKVQHGEHRVQRHGAGQEHAARRYGLREPKGWTPDTVTPLLYRANRDTRASLQRGKIRQDKQSDRKERAFNTFSYLLHWHEVDRSPIKHGEAERAGQNYLDDIERLLRMMASFFLVQHLVQEQLGLIQMFNRSGTLVRLS